MKRTIAALSIILVLASSVPASALVVPGQPPPPPAPTLGLVGGLTIGVLASAGLLCIYDVWLKINGFKNWDGSPKIAQAHHHHP